MSFPQKIREDLIDRFEIKIDQAKPVSGGDINEAFLVADDKGKQYFLKYSHEDFAHDMLEKEAASLEILEKTTCVETPGIIGVGDGPGFAYLLLEYIKPGRTTSESWDKFAFDLANLHRCSQSEYGLNFDNYIGRLHQPNTSSDSWIHFYREMRLNPQREMLIQNGFSGELPEMLDRLSELLPEILVEERPSLIHGDLWSGNFHPDQQGKVYLIDPAISYSHRELDIAMSMLFGGFPQVFYEAYHKFFPLSEGWESRMGIYQLYYVLAHVNLFGSSYIEQAKRIIKNYL